MINMLFITVLTAVLTVLLYWAFRALPAERWQMLAAVPLAKESSGTWQGMNLTYYGFFSAGAYVLALVILLTMLGSINITALQSLVLTTILLAICMPASRLLAELVEKRKHTFTVGGAAFIGIITLPWLISAVIGMARLYGLSRPSALSVLAAFGTAYCFGEGLGRLACISFGCCYGKTMRELPLWLQHLFARRAFIFQGDTKKIAYQGGFTDVPVLPVQAITSTICLLLGLAGMLLFLLEYYACSLGLTLAGSQLWRFYSEFWRTDYRGGTGRLKLSAYQVMALLAAIYTAPLIWLLKAYMPDPPAVAPQLMHGFKTLWQPGIILFLQFVWILVFLYTGRSNVTNSRISFHVKTSCI